jgi:hypothetical protein
MTGAGVHMRMNIWDWIVLICVVGIALVVAFGLGRADGIQQGESDMLAAFQSFGCLIEDPTEGMKE